MTSWPLLRRVFHLVDRFVHLLPGFLGGTFFGARTGGECNCRQREDEDDVTDDLHTRSMRDEGGCHCAERHTGGRCNQFTITTCLSDVPRRAVAAAKFLYSS